MARDGDSPADRYQFELWYFFEDKNLNGKGKYVTIPSLSHLRVPNITREQFDNAASSNDPNTIIILNYTQVVYRFANRFGTFIELCRGRGGFTDTDTHQGRVYLEHK